MPEVIYKKSCLYLEDKLINVIGTQQIMKKVENLLQSLTRSGKIKSGYEIKKILY